MTILLLSIKIFLSRIIDVTLGTIRTNFTVRGRTWTAGTIAFIEVLIWFLIAKEALNTDASSIWIAISYAGGYAVGTIIGTTISNRFINTLITAEVITSNATLENINKIREYGFGVSVINTTNNYENEPKSILLITLNSRYLNDLKKVITSIDAQAFVIVKESKIIQNGFIK